MVNANRGKVNQITIDGDEETKVDKVGTVQTIAYER